MSLSGFQFLVNQAENFHFWCPGHRWRHVRLRGWWLHNRNNAKKMVKLVIPISEKGWDQESLEDIQTNLKNALCAPFENFAFPSSLVKSRTVQSCESTKKWYFFEKFSVVTFHYLLKYLKGPDRAQKAFWRYFWDFEWWSRGHPFSEIGITNPTIRNRNRPR